jgi:multidrug efflux pump
VGFAVIATTVVLISVFVPITFLEGDIGRLFTEFAVTMTAAVIFSSLVALTFSPMLSSKIMDKTASHNILTRTIDRGFEALKKGYKKILEKLLLAPIIAILIIGGMLASSAWLMKNVPQEFTPKEDRGAFFMFIRGPEGASYDYTLEHLKIIEERLMPFAESGEFTRLLIRAPGSFGTASAFNDGIGIIVLNHWDSGRKPIWHYVNKVRELTSDIPGVVVFPVVRQALGGGAQKPMQFVIGGPTYQELASWRDILIDKANENPNLVGVDSDYRETKPQISVKVDKDRAAVLGVSIAEINTTLETALGSRRVTTFFDRGEEYDVILESEKGHKENPKDISKIYVRSSTTGSLIPLSNIVTIEEFADSGKLERYNRIRAITIESNLADGYSLGEALEFMEELVKTELPPGAYIDYKGPSKDYKDSGSSIYLVFIMALIVVFLVLAGQFESFIHPFVIMLTVPIAITGALAALYFTDQSINIYSQIGLIILVGLAAKNGILIVEFINQLRDEGVEFKEAVIEASARRLRPIIMTGITTCMGALPLIMSYGAGAETRTVIGIVIFTGVILTMLLTIFIVPMMYQLLAKKTKSPLYVTKRLEGLLEEYKDVK